MSEVALSTNALSFKAELTPWFQAAVAMLLLLLLCLVAAQFDDRTLYGISVWTKPAKFALSLAVYFATLIWFARYIDSEYRRAYFGSRAGKVLVWLPVLCAVFEMVYIVYQASLGEASHFNIATGFHATMYSLMGLGAVTLVSVLVWYAMIIARRGSLSDPMILAIVLGLVLSFLLGGGFGGYLSSASGHWVNAPQTDAGGSLLFGWARQGGDLRVAHFFGMHAMQALPLFACLLSQKWSVHTRIAWVVAFACGYTAFSIMTFLQAVSGQPFGV